MDNIITISGRILFNPKDYTKKHARQSSWKKMAMVMMKGDLEDYYAWFIKKRYGLELNQSLRGPHISFINDHIRDFKNESDKKTHELWDLIGKKYNGTEIDIVLGVDARSDGHHWWLNIPEEYRTELHGIRNELGLDRPNWGLHMSIGHANPKFEEHSNYIHGLIKKGLIQ